MGWGDQRRGFSDTVEVPELDLAVLFDNSQLVFKITGRERESECKSFWRMFIVSSCGTYWDRTTGTA